MAWTLRHHTPETLAGYVEPYRLYAALHGYTVPKGLFHYGRWLRQMRVFYLRERGVDFGEGRNDAWGMTLDDRLSWYIHPGSEHHEPFQAWLREQCQKEGCYRNPEVAQDVAATLAAA